MLSKKEIEDIWIEQADYLDDVVGRVFAQAAIFTEKYFELLKKLDEIERWANAEVMFTANTTGMAESVAYTRAQRQVLQILRGDE